MQRVIVFVLLITHYTCPVLVLLTYLLTCVISCFVVLNLYLFVCLFVYLFICLFVCLVDVVSVCYIAFDESVGLSGQLLVILKRHDKYNPLRHKERRHGHGQENINRNDEKDDDLMVELIGDGVYDDDDDDNKLMLDKDKDSNITRSIYYIQTFYNIYDLHPLIMYKWKSKRNNNTSNLVVKVYSYLYGNEFVQQFLNNSHE